MFMNILLCLYLACLIIELIFSLFSKQMNINKAFFFFFNRAQTVHKKIGLFTTLNVND